jgi:large subunit ribosomal protein L25
MNKPKKPSKKLQPKVKLSLNAEKRNVYGSKVKKLRDQEILPANLYGKDFKSQALKLDQKKFLDLYKKAGETGVIYLQIDKEKKPYSVLIHNVQFHPVAGSPLHVDFHKVDLTKKVQVNIPVELVGEAPGVSKGGVLVQVMNELEVEALPTDLPDKFEIDVSGLIEIGDSITVKDLKYNKDKINLLAEDEGQSIVNIEAPQEEEEEAPPAEEAEPEAEADAEEKPEPEKQTKEEPQEKPAEKKPQEQAGKEKK